MDEKPFTPPPRYPVPDLRSPNQRDGFYTELVNRTDSAYQNKVPIKRGTPYSTVYGADTPVIAQFPQGLYFLKEIKPGNLSDVGNTSDWVIWFWATVPLAQDTYNAQVEYDKEDLGFPIFTREVLVRRKDYEANPTLSLASTLTSLLSVNITNAGTGYTFATGTIATGATVEFVISSTGTLIDAVVTNEGASVTNGAAITITGDGTGGAATARIQPASAVLLVQKKVELGEDDPRSHDYVRLIRVYKTMPGPDLIGHEITGDYNGSEIMTTESTGLTGTVDPEDAPGVISSVTTPISAVEDKRVTKRVTSSLPATKKWAEWHYIPLPLLIFAIDINIYCNGTSQFAAIVNPDTDAGCSAFRKHRITEVYDDEPPDDDLSVSAFNVRDVEFRGKIIQFSWQNVLMDASSYSESFSTTSGDSSCSWTESWSFAATTPSATDFAAGDWYVRDANTVRVGTNLWKTTIIEFYSAPGDPAI